MFLGLVFAILFSYRKKRNYKDIPTEFTSAAGAREEDQQWKWKHVVTLIALAVTLVLQIVFGSLVIAALGGIFTMFILRAEAWHSGDDIVEGGVKMMGTIRSEEHTSELQSRGHLV